MHFKPQFNRVAMKIGVMRFTTPWIGIAKSAVPMEKHFDAAGIFVAFACILPLLLPFLMPLVLPLLVAVLRLRILRDIAWGSGIHSFPGKSHSNMEDRDMGAVKLSIEASGREGTEGRGNRTGESFVFPLRSRAQAAAGFQIIPHPSGGSKSVDFEPAEATDASSGELELWGAVLLQAIEDYHRKGAGYEVAVNGIRLRGWYYDKEVRRDKRRAETWFKSKSEDVGSFLWICDLLKLDPDRVWARIREKNFALTQ